MFVTNKQLIILTTQYIKKNYLKSIIKEHVILRHYVILKSIVDELSLPY